MAYIKTQALRAASVTPSDSANIPSVSTQDGSGNNGCAMYVGTGGDVKVTTAGGDVVTFFNLQDGSFVPVQVIRVWSTGTTASNIVALW